MGELDSFSNDALVGGAYRVVRVLDRGGMGAVYEVVQLATGWRRALKVMHAWLAADPVQRERFLREIRVAANIPSDHVVQVVDADVDRATNLPFFVMELLVGRPLSQELRRNEGLDPATAREIFQQLCHGVAAAHAAGIAHLDLKPANIFLADPRTPGRPFVVKVLDFGIAESIASARKGDYASGGTPQWMAPEQFAGSSPPSAAADVWALGLLAFSLFTGRSYWPATRLHDEATDAVFERLVSAQHVPASARAAVHGCSSRLPSGFDAWFARCLAVDPAARFPDAAAAYAAFVELTEAPPDSDARSNSLRPVASPSDSQRWEFTPEVSTQAATKAAVERPASLLRRAPPLALRVSTVALTAALAWAIGYAQRAPASSPLVPVAPGPLADAAAPATEVSLSLYASNSVDANLAVALAEGWLSSTVNRGAPARTPLPGGGTLVAAPLGERGSVGIRVEYTDGASERRPIGGENTGIRVLSRRIDLEDGVGSSSPHLAPLSPLDQLIARRPSLPGTIPPVSPLGVTDSLAPAYGVYVRLPDNATGDAERFAAFAASEAGQAVILRAGFPAGRPACDATASGALRSDASLRAAFGNACRLGVEIHFESKSFTLSPNSLLDLRWLGIALARAPFMGRGVAVVGYADPHGYRGDNDWLSGMRAGAVARELRARGVRVDRVEAMGSDTASASGTEEAVERARRVDLWVL